MIPTDATPALATAAATLAGLLLATPALAQRGGREFRPPTAEQLDPRLEALLESFETAQRSTRTLTATFTQVKEDELFAEATVQSGHFFYSQPDSFRWEYLQPEVVTVVTTRDVVQRYIPEERDLLTTDISKKRRRAFNYLGIGSDVQNLRRHFDITLVDDDDEHPGTDKIELRGAHRRIQKRMELLEMWLDRETSMPVAVRATMADGGATAWVFADMRVNVDLPEGVFELAVPEGVRVTSGTDGGDTLLDDLLPADDGDTSPPSGS